MHQFPLGDSVGLLAVIRINSGDAPFFPGSIEVAKGRLPLPPSILPTPFPAFPPRHPPSFFLVPRRSRALVLPPAPDLAPADCRFPPRLQNPFPAPLPCSRTLHTQTANLKKLKPPKRTREAQPGLRKLGTGKRASAIENRNLRCIGRFPGSLFLRSAPSARKFGRPAGGRERRGEDKSETTALGQPQVPSQTLPGTPGAGDAPETPSPA